MPENDHDKKPLPERAREVDDKWRKARRLTTNLNHIGNARARKRRQRAEAPKETKANVKFRHWRDKKLGKMGAASKVRRIDPATGEATAVRGDRTAVKVDAVAR